MAVSTAATTAALLAANSVNSNPSAGAAIWQGIMLIVMLPLMFILTRDFTYNKSPFGVTWFFVFIAAYSLFGVFLCIWIVNNF